MGGQQDPEGMFQYLQQPQQRAPVTLAAPIVSPQLQPWQQQNQQPQQSMPTWDQIKKNWASKSVGTAAQPIEYTGTVTDFANNPAASASVGEKSGGIFGA